MSAIYLTVLLFILSKLHQNCWFNFWQVVLVINSFVFIINNVAMIFFFYIRTLNYNAKKVFIFLQLQYTSQVSDLVLCKGMHINCMPFLYRIHMEIFAVSLENKKA